MNKWYVIDVEPALETWLELELRAQKMRFYVREDDPVATIKEQSSKLVSVELERDAYKRESETAAKLAGQSFRELSSALGRLGEIRKACEYVAKRDVEDASTFAEQLLGFLDGVVETSVLKSPVGDFFRKLGE